MRPGLLPAAGTGPARQREGSRDQQVPSVPGAPPGLGGTFRPS